MKSTTVTLRDIAEALKVSISTVSLALQDSPRLPAETRERVKKAADELGYRKDHLYSALMSRRRIGNMDASSHTIAFLCPFPEKKEWVKHPWLTRFYQGVLSRAQDYKCKVETYWLAEPTLSLKRLEQILQTQAIEGLIIGSFPKATTHLNLNWSRYVAVAQGQTLRAPQLHQIVNHYAATAMTALRELRRLGYERVGFFLEPEVDARDRRQWSGTFASYHHLILEEHRVPIFWWRHDEAAFYEWFKKHKPQVIFTTKPTVKDLLEQKKIRVPEDVGLALTSWQPIYPDWAGVNHQQELAGSTAVDVLFNQMLTHQYGAPTHPLTVLTEGIWVGGESLQRIGKPAVWPNVDPADTIHLPDTELPERAVHKKLIKTVTQTKTIKPSVPVTSLE